MKITSIKIRSAEPADVLAITTLFRKTIEQVNAKDYSVAHIKAWASGADDLEKWEERISEHYFVVAQINNKITGFAYITDGNYFDGLFVDTNYQGQGIASRLLDHIKEKICQNGYDVINSDVSITALPFFKKHGYRVIKKQQKPYKGLLFENYIVEKVISK